MIDKRADDIAQKIIRNADDDPIIEEIMKEFNTLTAIQKQTVVEILVGALLTARKSEAYPSLDK